MSTLLTTTSTSRPSLGSSDTGALYYETDTNRLIFWDGAIWNVFNRDSTTSPTTGVDDLNYPSGLYSDTAANYYVGATPWVHMDASHLDGLVETTGAHNDEIPAWFDRTSNRHEMSSQRYSTYGTNSDSGWLDLNISSSLSGGQCTAPAVDSDYYDYYLLPTAVASVPAAKATANFSSIIDLEAVQAGIAGNSITFEVNDGQPADGVTVSGDAVIVTLTGYGYQKTNQQLKDLLDAESAVAALVSYTFTAPLTDPTTSGFIQLTGGSTGTSGSPGINNVLNFQHTIFYVLAGNSIISPFHNHSYWYRGNGGNPMTHVNTFGSSSHQGGIPSSNFISTLSTGPHLTIGMQDATDLYIWDTKTGGAAYPHPNGDSTSTAAHTITGIMHGTYAQKLWELLVFEEALSITDINTVKDYFQNKYAGLSDSLPSSGSTPALTIT